MAGLRIAARALSKRLTSAFAAPAYAGAGAVRGMAEAAQQAKAPSPPTGASPSELMGEAGGIEHNDSNAERGTYLSGACS